MVNNRWTRKKQAPIDQQLDAALSKIYYGFGKEGALQNTPQKLLTIARRRLPAQLRKRLSLQRLKVFLTRQPSYTVHRHIHRRSFPRRRIKISHRGQRFDADLLDLQDLKRQNKQYAYVLTVIDTFTKYLWGQPIKTKSGPEVAAALKDVFTAGLAPQFLYTDKGKEFLNSHVQDLLKQYNVVHRVCTSESYHCPFVERVNRTLKDKLFQAMTATTTQNWFDLLPRIISTYNKTVHSTTKMAPESITDDDTLQVFRNSYLNHLPQNVKRVYKFKKGDYVRIAKAQTAFSRGYLPRFTWEIFQIADLVDTDSAQLPAYRLQDLNGTLIEHALFYEPELSKVDAQLVHGPKAVFPIHEVLKRRTVNGKKELLVWWKGWPKDAAEWITDTQIRKGI